MKSRIHDQNVSGTAILVYLMLAVAVSAKADVVRQSISYPPDAVAGWTSIDFDGDGVFELSFEVSGEFGPGGVMSLDVFGSASTHVLLQDERVLPLQSGDTVLQSPVNGQWQATGSHNSVWTVSYGSLPEAPPPPPPEGVGMEGYGNYMGVRYVSGSDWHYGWVRFGMLDIASPPLPPPQWPSVLEFACETFPDTAIMVPEPSSLALLIGGGLTIVWRTRKKRMGQQAGCTERRDRVPIDNRTSCSRRRDVRR
jgi:hypothetical protein